MAKKCHATQSESRQRQVFPTTTNYTTTNMTLEEAKQLKPGDRVLVEMDIDDSSVFNEYGHVCLESAYVLPQDIREKIAPPRRKFKAGDIVAVKNEAIYYVTDDEQEGRRVYLSITGKSEWDIHLVPDDLTLICAVENREDRSAAADGSGVTRKGGEV